MPVRKCTDISPPQWSTPPRGEVIELRLKTITPMFGGGYEARNVDPVCIIRPAAIRGHLRFWWRATVGAQYATAEELFRAEEAIWGSAAKDGDAQSGPGKVTVEVRDVVSEEPVRCAQYVRDRRDPTQMKYRLIPDFKDGWPAYALHPFQGALSEDKSEIIEQPSECWPGVGFTVRIGVSPEAAQESFEAVVSAIEAWVKYGGLGARTRRGCGSLELLGGTSGTIAACPPLNRNLSIPTLSGSVVVLGTKCKTAIEAWKSAVETYRDFRQGVGYARSRGTDKKRPGRSLWPEPDTIRRITTRYSRNHSPTHPVRGFPRADLGLPIVFHFKDHEYGDPSDCTLEGPRTGQSRLASPVITKAAPVPGGYAPMICILNAPHAWQLGDLLLKGASSRPSNIHRQEIELTDSDRADVLPLRGFEVRDALARFVETKWKVKREVLP